MRPGFDVVETPDATLFAKFVGRRNQPGPTEKQIKQILVGNYFIGFSVTNPH